MRSPIPGVEQLVQRKLIRPMVHAELAQPPADKQKDVKENLGEQVQEKSLPNAILSPCCDSLDIPERTLIGKNHHHNELTTRLLEAQKANSSRSMAGQCA